MAEAPVGFRPENDPAFRWSWKQFPSGRSYAHGPGRNSGYWEGECPVAAAAVAGWIDNNGNPDGE